MVRLGGFLVMLMLWVSGVKAQQEALMTIDGEKVTCAEYEAFCLRKGLSMQAVDTFINYKLKVNAARHLRLDTLSLFRSFVDSCRHSLSKKILIGRKGSQSDYRAPGASLTACRVLVSHIFRYIPQNATSHMLLMCQARMDSLYSWVMSGENSFEENVRKYSQEKEPFWVDGMDMPAEFEEVAFTLPVGGISKPFFTPQGIHILKVLQREPAGKTERAGSPNGRCLPDMALDSLKRLYHFLPDKDGIKDFLTHGMTKKNLFSLEGKIYSGSELAMFALSHPASPKRQLEGFITKAVLACADLQLEKNSPEYRLSLQAYSDSLLYHNVTDYVLGKRLLSDTVGVMRYFEHNRKSYRWPESRFEGIVLHCVSKRVSKKVKKFLKKLSPDEWQDAIRLGVNSNGPIVAGVEQGLFAPGDNPYVDDMVFKMSDSRPMEGFPYTSVIGKKKKGPEHWTEVGDRLWADYRNYKDACWIEDLRNSAKVEINQEVLKTVNNH